jgi:hypothetical protein
VAVELVLGVAGVAPPFLIKVLAVVLSAAAWLVSRWSLLSVTAKFGHANGRTPLIPDVVPFIGHAKTFGEDLLGFLVAQRKIYGDIFRVRSTPGLLSRTPLGNVELSPHTLDGDKLNRHHTLHHFPGLLTFIKAVQSPYTTHDT